MKAIGIDGCYLKLFVDFLFDRKQCVNNGASQSSVMPVPSGTIQGSVIGGTLFCIFINDLSAVIKYCHKWLFIDDLKLVFDANTRKTCALIQLDLNAICEWSGKISSP